MANVLLRILFVIVVQKQPHILYIIITGHIIISPVPALSRAVLVDQACVDPVYVQSSGSDGIRTHNLLLQYHRREL